MRLVLALSLALGCALPAVAQPTDVPGELALGLLGLADADGLRPGEVPDALRPFLPEGAVVVGSLDSGSDDEEWGRITTVLVRLPGDPDANAAAFAGREVPGYTVQTGFRAESSGGFVSTIGPERAFQYYPATRDGRVVGVRFSERPWGGSFARIDVRGLFPRERLPSEPDPEPLPFDRLQPCLPPLTALEDTRLRRMGGGGGREEYHSRAALTGATVGLPMDTLATHFAGQMAGGGWAPGGASVSDDLATSAWTRTCDGMPLGALFYARRTGDGEFDLSVQVVGPSDPR